jgi:PKHD-type hydroxylase
MILYFDEKYEFQFYAIKKNVLSTEECKKIIEVAKNKNLEQGKIFSKEEVLNVKDVRDSSICWLNETDDLNWLLTKIAQNCLEVNKTFFKFDLNGILESLQFTNYKAPSGKYGKHVDCSGSGVTPSRKLSITIQLTDPNEYEGGELVLYDSEKPTMMDKEQGSLIVFPSYVLHEVKPVTKGERNSLVCWVTGKPFR